MVTLICEACVESLMYIHGGILMVVTNVCTAVVSCGVALMGIPNTVV